VTPFEEIAARGRRDVESSKRTNANVCIGIGVIFAVFAAVSFIVAIVLAALAAGAEVEAQNGGWLAVGFAVGVAVFGLMFVALAALLIVIGRKGLQRLARGQRLRATGVRGLATVLSYSASDFKVDGATNWRVAVRIALDGRPPLEMSLSVPVVRGEGGRIYQGATLPVLVNPADTSEAMVDFDAPPDT
jgi:membrane protein implicated in regulation of membrane protease activity